MRFAGKAVLVTGGASGIGQGIALAFAQQGANVAITHLTSDPEPTIDKIQAMDRRVLAIRADLRDEATVEGVVQQTVSTLGGLDILVANAGGLVKRARVVDTPLELWSEVVAVNLTATFLCCRAALRHMERNRGGTLILVSSLAGHDGGGLGASHYAAAKGAILTYTRAVAKEVGHLGIRVNGVAPGLIATSFHDRFTPPDGRRATVERTPLRREGTARDVAGAGRFLAARATALRPRERMRDQVGVGGA